MGGFKGNMNALPGGKKEQRFIDPGTKAGFKRTDDMFLTEPTTIPPPKPIAPPPTVDEDQVASSSARKRKRGRQSTFLTGDLVPTQNKKTTLG